MAQLFPSLISAHLLNLKGEIDLLEPYVTGFHLDVMDFHFVPNLTWGPAFINAIRQATTKQIFVHLMVDNPGLYLERLSLHKNDIVSIHIESLPSEQLISVLNNIAASGWIPSIAINPETSLHHLDHFKDSFRHLLLMSVHPGFSGQTFLEGTYERLKEVVEFRKKSTWFPIAIDGGITPDIAPHLESLGADQFAVASAIFNHKDPLAALRAFHTLKK